jgi:acylphosphatase
VCSFILLSDDKLVAFRVIALGKVQGVFFRASMVKIAEENRVVGWVRNLDNGGVESLVQGKRSDVERVIDWCRKGPSKAVVENLEVQVINFQPDLRNFSIVY